MPEQTIKLPFNVGDKVMVKEIQRPGRIELIQLDYLGTQFRIALWDNSDRKSVWLYADEIEAR